MNAQNELDTSQVTPLLETNSINPEENNDLLKKLQISQAKCECLELKIEDITKENNSLKAENKFLKNENAILRERMQLFKNKHEAVIKELNIHINPH